MDGVIRIKLDIVLLIMMLIALLSCVTGKAETIITHKCYVLVVDSTTNTPIPFANIGVKELKKIYQTDTKGIIALPLMEGNRLEVSSFGYETNQYCVQTLLQDTILIRLKDSPFQLNELIVGKKKDKYSKKNNPAVDLIRKVKSDYKLISPKTMPHYSYNGYEKIIMGGNGIKNNSTDKINKYLKLEQFIDTAPWTGRRVLDLALFEKAFIRKEGLKDKKEDIILGENEQGLHEMLPFDNIRDMIGDVMREINIYDDDISLIQNRFVSPLSPIGPDFYKYNITDTVFFDDDKCIEVTFVPKTPETFGFNGKLYIPLEDSIRYVKRVSMRVPKAINLNYIDNIFVSQNYYKDSLGMVHKTLDDVVMELSIIKKTPSLFANRQSRYNNFLYSEIGDSLMKEGINLSNGGNSPEFWDSRRSIPFSMAEQNLVNLKDVLRRNKFIFWGEKLFKPIFEGYVGTLPKNSKFNIGPVNTFVSFNDVEGLRLKVGGMSTSTMSRHFFLRGYCAYGFEDRKLKYLAEAEYSFIKKEKHSREFPMNGIRLTFKYDIEQLGERYLYSNADNIILSFKRRRNDLVIYRRLAQLEYNLELKKNLSFNLGLRSMEDHATKWVKFINGWGRNFETLTSTSFFATVRYAPGEKFVQGTTNRRPINMDAPIVAITQEYGLKHFLGSNFTLNKTEVSALKRFWFSAFGYSNVLLKGGKIWSSVPFPYLLWQNANLSYTIQPETFSLLNPMEFAFDEFVSWDIEYFMNGAILNRIPLIKKTKLREIISFKGIWGTLTKRNNPQYHQELLSFPEESSCCVMGRKPYMEIGVGLDNILTILRVDYVWRLSYRNNPGIDKSGVRVSLHFSF